MAKSVQSKQIEDTLGPVVAYNKIIVEASAKVLSLQVATIQKLAKIGFDNWNAVLSAKSAEDIKIYADKQLIVANEVSKIVTNDAREIGELNTHILENSRQLFEHSVNVATAKAA